MPRPDKLPKILTERETERLLGEPNLRYFGPHRDYLFMRLMLQTGLRSAEAVSLRPEHVNMTTSKLNVREGKGAKDRTLWMGEELRGELGEWMERRSEVTAGAEATATGRLLPTRKGTTVATSHLRRSVKRYARKAELPEVERVSPHTLRHTFATRLYRETGKIRTVQKALGHSDLSTTMIYTHVVDEELETAMKGLGA